MADAAITFNGLQSFEVQTDLAAEIPFDHIFAILDRVNDLGKLLFGEVLGSDAAIDLSLGQDFHRVGGADAVNVAQRDVDALFAGDLNANDACHNFPV